MLQSGSFQRDGTVVRYLRPDCRSMVNLADSATLRRLRQFGSELVEDFALWGEGVVGLRQERAPIFINCPSKLQSKVEELLAGRPAPTYLTAGPQGQCYVQFVDGQTAWQAPDSFTEAIHTRDARVQEVALGQWGTWVITFEDGTTSWCGVPEGLHKLLHTDKGPRGRRTMPNVCSVSLSPDSEAWFVRYTDGSWRAHCPSHPPLLKALSSLRASDADVRRVRLGSEHNFFIQYSHPQG